MKSPKDSLDILLAEEEATGFDVLRRKPVSESPDSVVLAAGAIVVTLDSFDLAGRPMVSAVPGLTGEVVVARTVVPLSRDHVGSEVVVLFEQQNVRRPVIMGLLQTPRTVGEAADPSSSTVSVRTDDERIVLSADREIVLRCGQASVTLTKAGKVLIQGAYVSSRSSGVNRIKGGSVQIN